MLFSCADGDASPRAAHVAGPTRGSTVECAPVAEETEPRAITVEGEATTDLGDPIVGRAIVLVDALGTKRVTSTIEGGVFHADGVVPPYDLEVAAAPSGDVVVPTVLLGITRPDPVIELFEREGPSALPAAQGLVLAVKVPPCVASGCTVTAVSASAHGGASARVTYEGAPPPVRLVLEHAWSSVHLTAAENVDIHVLVSDAARTTFAYAQIAAFPAVPGQDDDLGVIEPEPVASSGPVAITVDASAFPSSWREQVAVHVDLPGGAAVPFVEGPGASIVTRVPLLPGATLRAGTWSLEPRDPGSPSAYGAVHTWSGARSIASASIHLEPTTMPSLVRPKRDGAMSRRGIGFAWSGGGTALSTLTVVDVTRAVTRLRVVLDGDEIPLARLASLGMGRLELGAHVLDLETCPGAVIDSATSPDRSVRRRRFDPEVEGRTSYQRHAFTVTP